MPSIPQFEILGNSIPKLQWCQATGRNMEVNFSGLRVAKRMRPVGKGIEVERVVESHSHTIIETADRRAFGG
jgi:hypothetical protein